MYTHLMKKVLSAEYLFAAVFIAIFFVSIAGFDWWWLLVWFLAFDISAIGYIINNRIGALTYNIGHSLIGPAILAMIYISTSNETILFITLLWLFHIFVDRALGYGLKHTTSFTHTHLGKIGKAKTK